MPDGTRVASVALLAVGMLALSARPTPAPEASPGASAPAREAYDKAASELICYCGCSRQTIKDCSCGVAFDLREQFEARLASGETADAIIASYIAEHGEQARNVPQKKGINLLAWWGPAVGILTAGGVTLGVLAVWAARGRRMAAAPAPAPADGDQELRTRLERELKEFE